MFDDDRIVHRATVTDLETGEQFVDTYNFTTIELSKVPFFIEASSDSVSKWLFFFRFLNRLRDLPVELAERKFELLTESSKVSNLSKEEFKDYLAMYHKEWDHNAMVEGVFEEFADEINAKVSESVSENTREIARKMRSQGVADSIIVTATGLTEAEVKAL